ncbi:MAG: nucleotidyltransferase domain-containing protein [Bacteroidota bacterium]
MVDTQTHSYTKHQVEIIKAVLYFEIFEYPLTADELYENSTVDMSKAEFNTELEKLLALGTLIKSDKFILSVNGNDQFVAKRIKGNKGADGIMATAYKYSKKIASFPFVEGICLSGGLSKNYYDENGDIDFFIITKPGRLWICRTLLIVKFKLLPKHKKKYWCVNYFISSDNLAIPENNVFTGTELAYLIPTVNYNVYRNILQKNSWYKNRFPNKQELPDNNCISTPSTLTKKVIEKSLSGALGKWADDFLLRITLRHWRKKYPELNNEDFELQFRSRKDVCKRHTKGFQNIVLNKWEQKQHEYKKHLNITFT